MYLGSLSTLPVAISKFRIASLCLPSLEYAKNGSPYTTSKSISNSFPERRPAPSRIHWVNFTLVPLVLPNISEKRDRATLSNLCGSPKEEISNAGLTATWADSTRCYFSVALWRNPPHEALG